MRAAVIHSTGPADGIRVEDLPIPETRPGEVLVRVTATTVNHVDTFVRSGAYRTPLPFPFVVGRDLVGSVEHTASDVTDLLPGDAVWCNSLGHGGRQGAAAQFAAVPRERLYRIPDGVDPIDLVALAHPAATAWLGLVEHGRLRPGGTAFVGGGGGNVGSCAVAFALSMGAGVVTTAGARDLERLAAMGAVAYDYRDPDMVARLEHALTRGASGTDAPAVAGADVWLDTSGSLDLSRAVGLLADRGRIVLIAGMRRHDGFGFGDLYTHDRSIVGFAISNATVAELGRAADAIGAAMASGSLPVPAIERRRLEDTAAAHADVEAGLVRGRRIVLVP
jgi:NADPH:quinone reductase-like Zn-dependent oxidoreductase